MAVRVYIVSETCPEQAAQMNLQCDTHTVCHCYSCINALFQSRHFSLKYKEIMKDYLKVTWPLYVLSASLCSLAVSDVVRRLLQTGPYFSDGAMHKDLI